MRKKKLVSLILYPCLLLIFLLSIGSQEITAGKIVPHWKDVEGFPDLKSELGAVELNRQIQLVNEELIELHKNLPAIIRDRLLKVSFVGLYDEDEYEVCAIDLVWDKDKCSVMIADGFDVDLEEYLSDLFKIIGPLDTYNLKKIIAFYPQVGFKVKLRNRLKDSEFIRTVTLLPNGRMQLSEQENEDAAFETLYEHSFQIVDK